MDGYQVERDKLAAHARSLEDIATSWNVDFSEQLQGNAVVIPPDAFTLGGQLLSSAYNQAVFQLGDALKQTGQAFRHSAHALEYAVRTYGQAEDIVREGVKHLEVAPSPLAPELRKLLGDVIK